MDIGALFGALGASVVSNATLQGVVILTVLDFILGTIKAIGNRSFRIQWVDAWVGDHFVKVVTIVLGILFGIVAPPIVIGTFSFNAVGAAAETAAIAYIAKTAASVLANFNFASADPPPASITGDTVAG